MSIHFYISVLWLISAFISSVNGLEQYLIRKDLFRGFKSGEYTVYDPQEKDIYCRIESNYGMLQNIEIIAYPFKEEIGRLQAKLNFITYKAEITVLDRKSNEWVNGLIKQIFKWTGDLYTIELGKNNITMENTAGPWTHVFRDSVRGELLAQFRLQPGSILWANKYDLQIFSKKYPKQIYLLGLAAHDRPRGKG